MEMLVSPPNLALRNKMQGSASFRILEKRVQMTQLCGEELLDNLLKSKEGEPYEEREVTPRHKDTWAAPSTKETRAGFVNLVPNKASSYTKKIIPTNEKKFMLIQDVEVIWQCLFPKQSRPCCVISMKTNESLMVRDVGSQSNQFP